MLRRAAGSGMLGRLLDCFYCLSLWVAVPLALVLGDGWREQLLLIPALSAAAILVERATVRPTDPVAAWYHEAEATHEEEANHEEEEAKDVVLWEEADGVGRDGGAPVG